MQVSEVREELADRALRVRAPREGLRGSQAAEGTGAVKLKRLPEDLKRLVAREWGQGLPAEAGEKRRVRSAAHHVAVFLIESGNFTDLGRTISCAMELGMLAQEHVGEPTPDAFVAAVEAKLEEDWLA